MLNDSPFRSMKVTRLSRSEWKSHQDDKEICSFSAIQSKLGAAFFKQQQRLMWLMKRSTGREWPHFPTLKDILVVRLRKGETVSLPLAPGLTWLQNLTSNKSTVSTAKYTHTYCKLEYTHFNTFHLFENNHPQRNILYEYGSFLWYKL